MFQKKSLGQHFLTSSAYVRAVAEAGDIHTDDTVLEIGPGKGVLTAELLSRGARVIAVEKDRRLIPVLREKFAQEIAEEELILHEGDILMLDTNKLVHTEARNHLPFRVIANIPYYITGALFEKFLGGRPQPSTIVFLVQKEVAERIAPKHLSLRAAGRTAEGGSRRKQKESILSLSVKAFGNPRYVKTVPRGAFAPAPNVDSAILAIENISRKNFENAAHEKKFFDLLHAGFAHKRKLLVRNLESVLGENTGKALTDAGIPQKARAEDVPLEKWLKLSRL